VGDGNEGLNGDACHSLMFFFHSSIDGVAFSLN